MLFPLFKKISYQVADNYNTFRWKTKYLRLQWTTKVIRNLEFLNLRCDVGLESTENMRATMHAWILNFVFEKVSRTLASMIRIIKDLTLVRNICFPIPEEPNKACWKDLFSKQARASPCLHQTTVLIMVIAVLSKRPRCWLEGRCQQQKKPERATCIPILSLSQCQQSIGKI